MKYKVGDKVKIVSKRVFGMNEEGEMDKYLGLTMTISDIEDFRFSDIEDFRYRMLEDNGKWAWDDNMIKGLANKTKTLKTWEMIKELTENPEKKFRLKGNDVVLEVVDEEIDLTGIDWVLLDDEWEEVKEPVDFMTAIKSRKFVRVEHELLGELGGKWELNNFTRLDLLMEELADNFFDTDLAEILENGEWYIED